jgi:hypothetical protein
MGAECSGNHTKQKNLCVKAFQAFFFLNDADFSTRRLLRGGSLPFIAIYGDNVVQRIGSGPPPDKSLSVFLSHSTKDRQFVEMLAAELDSLVLVA